MAQHHAGKSKCVQNSIKYIQGHIQMYVIDPSQSRGEGTGESGDEAGKEKQSRQAWQRMTVATPHDSDSKKIQLIAAPEV